MRTDDPVMVHIYAWEVYKALLANSGYLEKSYEEIAKESYKAVETFEKFVPDKEGY